MRARSLLVAGLLAAFAIACAPPGEDPQEAESSPEPRDLSLLEAATAAAVVSDIEAGDTDPVPVRPHQAAVTAAPAGHMHAEEPRPHRTDPAPFVVATSGAVEAPAVSLPQARPAAMPEAGAGDAEVDDAGSGPSDADQPSAGRGVLIRGGVRADDDCAAHMRPRTGRSIPGLGQPGLGAPGPGDALTPPDPGAAEARPDLVRPPQGALVNERAPRAGLPRAGRGGGIRF